MTRKCLFPHDSNSDTRHIIKRIISGINGKGKITSLTEDFEILLGNYGTHGESNLSLLTLEYNRKCSISIERNDK
ncbi:hypothetical protein Glove_21g318 [Diversispora epigaea]|uniref:Uncharacterized protein n=1 Tax=Diversispora epigaea TaxID=1348612 RepID=A0A397JU12_9GLOM|nr:hypothetical protein Glove_21g318 [Diversispora epigaea]